MSEYIFAWALEKRIERRDFLVCFTFTLQFQKSPTQQPNIIEKTETTVVLIVLYGILYHIRRAAKIIFAPQGKRKLSPPPSSISPNNDTQAKSTTVCHKQGISTTKMNWWIVIYFVCLAQGTPPFLFPSLGLWVPWTHGPRGASPLRGPAHPRYTVTVSCHTVYNNHQVQRIRFMY